MGTSLMNKMNGTIASGDDVGAEIADASPGRHLLRKKERKKKNYATLSTPFFFFFNLTTISRYQT